MLLTNLRTGIAGEPESEVGVGVLHVEVLADFLQRGHPGDGEMAILEGHPGALLLGPPDHLVRHRPLDGAGRSAVKQQTNS